MSAIHPSSLQIHPLSSPLSAVVRVPGSKSLTNRALLIAALASGQTRLTNALFSDDSQYFANALKTLGFNVELDETAHTMTVTGLGGRIPAAQASLFIGNAGTAARFLTAFLKLGHGVYLMDGDARMRERPIGDLLSALNQLMGMNDEKSNDPWRLVPDYSHVSLPIQIQANGLIGGRARVAGNISSQFLSALLMVAPYAQDPVEIELITELNSKPYVDMTIAIMKDFGVDVKREGYERFTISPSTYSAKTEYAIESDASAASYFFAAPAICGGTVKVENISRKSLQGDVAFVDVLAKMGCTVEERDNSIQVTGAAELQGVDVDMRDIPDTAQTLAAIAPFAVSPTRIHGIASARVKETDRIHATCTELARLGVRVEEAPDGMTIHPVEKMRNAVIQTYNDHRMAMSFALIGLKFDGVQIQNPECVSKTFPNFFETLELLR